MYGVVSYDYFPIFALAGFPKIAPTVPATTEWYNTRISGKNTLQQATIPIKSRSSNRSTDTIKKVSSYRSDLHFKLTAAAHLKDTFYVLACRRTVVKPQDEFHNIISSSLGCNIFQ